MSRWFAAAWLFAVLLCCGAAAAAVTLTDVRVRGNLRVESGLILQQVSSQPGTAYAVETVREDIRAIYQLGFFEDIEVELEEGGVLTFLVLERPALHDWRAEGVDELDEEEVSTAVSLRKREILDMADVEAGAKGIRGLFRDKGFYLARVQYEVENLADGKNQVDVVYRAEPGEKVRVKSLNLFDISSIDAAELHKVLATGEAGEWSWLTGSGKFKETDLLRDVEVIRAFYLNEGYFDVKVGEPLVTLTEDRKWIKVDVPVHEGRRYWLGEIEFSGDLEFDDFMLRSAAGLVPAGLFRSDDVRKAMDNLTDLYGDIGYAFVQVNPRTRRHDKQQRLDVEFQIDKGEPVRIGRIEIRGNTKTYDRVIRREMRLAEGDLYNRSRLKRSQQKLRALDFFENINFNTHRRPGTDLLDIDIEVEEKATGSFSVGAGYSSADGIIGMINVNQRNFLGLGYQLSMQLNFGTTRETYSLSFNNPRLFDSSVFLGGTAFKSYREYTDYDKDALGVNLRLGTALGEDWRTLWTYRWEDAEVKNVDPLASDTIKDQVGTTVTSSITPTLTYDTRDNPWDPTAGSKLDLSVEWASSLLGGDTAFLKYDVDATRYTPMLWDTTFMVHAMGGYIQGLKDKEIPIYERYYLGGINSVRGYDTRSIGPIDAGTGEVIGGDKMLLFNLEYIFPLIPEAKVKGLVFFDAGNSWGEGETFLETPLLKSVGTGVRWLSPMGPLRLEWGYVLDPRPDDARAQWEFSVGGFF